MRTSRAGEAEEDREGEQRALLRAHFALPFALILVLGVFAAQAAIASASGEIHRSFIGKLSASGSCTLGAPGGVAVNNATGEIYVFDREVNSVDRFAQDGTCIEAFKAGPRPKGSPTFEGIAVDNSAGPSSEAIYVVNAEAKGQLIAKFRIVSGKAVKVGEIKTEIEGAPAEFKFTHGIGVDGAGNLYVYWGGKELSAVIEKFSGGEPNTKVSSVPFGGECQPRNGFAVSTDGASFYAGAQKETPELTCEPTAVIDHLNAEGNPVGVQGGAGLDGEASTAAAVDGATGEAFVGNITSVATFTAADSFTQRVGAEATPPLASANGIGVNATTGNVYVSDGEARQIDIFAAALGGLPEGVSLIDGRGYEVVTPQDKLGAQVFGITNVFGLIQASESGNAITYATNAPVVTNPPASRGPEDTQNLATRGSAAWETQDLSTPRGQKPTQFPTSFIGEYRFFAPDLSRAVVQPDTGGRDPHELALTANATETTLYTRDLFAPPGSCEPVPSTCYEAIVTPEDVTSGAAFGQALRFVTATHDAKHVAIDSAVGLTPGATGDSYYLWEGGHLRLINVLPISEGGAEGEKSDVGIGLPGEIYGDLHNAIARDGSRVFWTDEIEQGLPALYVRDFGRDETLRIDTAQGVTKPKESAAVFMGASEDGSTVFFTDTKRLTPNASPNEPEGEENSEGDLYACALVEREHKLACNLTDLTPGPAGHQVSGVQGQVYESEDGSYVYFMANGALAAGASQGNCKPVQELNISATCNLYVEHFNGTTWEAPKYIASLDGEDAPDWNTTATENSHSTTQLTARVSPNGHYFAFMSNRSLTGYDNRDASPEAEGARDEEVFLYNAGESTVACASCNPNNERPHGIFDSEQTNERLGLLIDRNGSWATLSTDTPTQHNAHWLAANIPGWTAESLEVAQYQSRYLSNNGRLFFNSVAALVPGDKNNVADVYEYEQDSEGSCTSTTGCIGLISGGEEGQTRESSFLDASSSGNDVFFLTASPLVKQDIDTSYDIYDARICTPSSPCQTAPPENPPPCEGEACKPAATEAPASPPVPASTIPGPGNKGKSEVLGVTETRPPAPTVETRAQKLAKALKACKKVKKHKKRVACERTARKKYGPVKHKAKKASHR